MSNANHTVGIARKRAQQDPDRGNAQYSPPGVGLFFGRSLPGRTGWMTLNASHRYNTTRGACAGGEVRG